MASVSKTGNVYANTTPGNGPFAPVWSGADTKLGTLDDSRLNPFVTVTDGSTSRFFYHVGNGVYVETANQGDTVAKDPLTYYFAGKLVTQSDAKSAAGADTATKVAALFPLDLQVNQENNKFQPTFGNMTEGIVPVTGYTKVTDGGADNANAYLMPQLTVGRDGNNYIYLGTEKLGYIGPGKDGILADAGTVADVRVWPSALGIGTPQDIHEPPSDFTEPFLKGKSLDDLAVGGTFDVDGYTWVVLDIDDYGNRLITTTAPAGSGALGNTFYTGSAGYTAHTNMLNRMTTIKPYAQKVDLPQNYLSSVGTTYGPIAFPLSKAEYDKYQTTLDANWTGGIYWLRSNSANANYGDFVQFNTTTKKGTTSYSGVNNSTSWRPAMWVKFSDAKNYLRADDKAFLPASFTNKVGDTFTADGYNWVVLTKDASGNSLIMTAETVSAMGARSNGTYTSDYSNTYWPSRAQTFYNNLSTLKTYGRGVTIPAETRYPNQAAWSSIPRTDGLTTCTNVTTGATAFPLSAGEYCKYILDNPELAPRYTVSPNNTAMGLRSVYSTGYAVGVSWLGTPSSLAGQYSYTPRLAMWVNFGSL